MGIGSAAFIDFFANFNYTSANFGQQWVLNDGLGATSMRWPNKIYNKKVLTVGVNVNNAEPINTQLGILNQQVYNEIKAGINEWQVRPEVSCVEKAIDLKLNIIEVNGGPGHGRCLLENNFDISVCPVDNYITDAKVDIYFPGNYFGNAISALIFSSLTLHPLICISYFFLHLKHKDLLPRKFGVWSRMERKISTQVQQSFTIKPLIQS